MIKSITKSNNKVFFAGILSFLIVSVFLFAFMIINSIAPFGNNTFANGDCFHQTYLFLACLQTKLKNGESLFYSWNGGLGSDFLPTLFYYVASPFNLIVVFFDKSDLNAFISISISIKISLSAFFFFVFITYYQENKDNHVFNVVLSCCYALSAYMCCYNYQCIWLDSIMVFPLIMLGYIRMIKDKKPLLYVLALAYSLYCNYYISYIICLFLLIWFLLDTHDSFKDFIRNSILFACYSILSAGLSFFSLYSSFIGLRKTASVEEPFARHFWYGNIFEVIRQMFIFPKPVKISYSNNDANLYCGLGVLLLLFVFIFIKKYSASYKLKRIILIVFLIVSMNENILNFIWHGFHDQHSVPNRFSFIYIFVMLCISADVYGGLTEVSGKGIVVSGLLSGFLPIVTYFFVDFEGLISPFGTIIISTIIIFVYSILLLIFIVCKSENKQKIIMCIFSTILLAEIITNAYSLLKNVYMDSTQVDLFYSRTENSKKIIEAEDNSGFYRSEMIDGLSNNDNSFHDMYGIGEFNSTINKEIPSFLQSMGYHISKNRIINNDSYDMIDDITGMKYLYTYGGNHNYEDGINYQLVSDLDGVKVYKNRNALSIGYGVKDAAKNHAYYSDYYVSNNINRFINLLTPYDNLFSLINPNYEITAAGCTVELEDTDHLSFNYEKTEDAKQIIVEYLVAEDGEYYTYLENENEDDIAILINDIVIKNGIWLTNGLNKLGHLKAGDKVDIIIEDNKGTTYQENNNSSKVSIITYVVDNIIENDMIDYLSQNQMKVTSFRDGSLSGEVTISEGQTLFTSIPYDRGWHVYENGKEIKTFKIVNAFLGVDIKPGKHQLVFKFIPEGIYLGVIVTVASFVILLIIQLFGGNKNSERNHE